MTRLTQITRRSLLTLAAALLLAPAVSIAADDPLHVHMLSGSNEYKSEASLTKWKEHLEQKFGDKVEVTMSPGKDKGNGFPDLAPLADADVMVVFARRNTLPDDQLALIKSHVHMGKPVIGIRTANHAFQNWITFDDEVLGGDYTGHYGNDEVTVEFKASDHAVLKGVGAFKSRKLYKAGKMSQDVKLLQVGMINGDKRENVTWVREHNGGRVFFTSLGVPEDFDDPNFVKMIDNALMWVSKREQ